MAGVIRLSPDLLRVTGRERISAGSSRIGAIRIGRSCGYFSRDGEAGIFEQMRYHSPTSQYGVLSRRHDSTGSSTALRKRMEEALTKIQSGEFAQEWTKEQAEGYPSFTRLRQEAYAHPLNDADRRVRALLAMSHSSTSSS